MPTKLPIDFQNTQVQWDGFGVNYVEGSHSRDATYEDYGSFSEMAEETKEMILDMIFGADGLKPGIMKIFLSSHLLPEPPQIGVVNLDDYLFETYLKENIAFVQEAMRRSAENGITLRFIATMYGPPAWANKQKIIRGKELDPAMREPLATYLAGCAKYLRERAGIPVEAISLHNEGEDPNRYPGTPGDDFNMYWTPDQIADIIPRVRRQLDKVGLPNVKVAPGETTNWGRTEPYAWAIGNDPDALASLGLLTSHNFGRTHANDAIGFIRNRCGHPELAAWTTSTSWKMTGGIDYSADFVSQLNQLDINALIPWAIIQTPEKWPGGDPNPNPPFLVKPDRTVSVGKSYYYYKQFTRAGAAGTNLVRVDGDRFGIHCAAWGKGETNAPDAILIVNEKPESEIIHLTLKNTDDKFQLFRTNDGEESYTSIGEYTVEEGRLVYEAPGLTVSTFIAK